jgi:hypothetical protein
MNRRAFFLGAAMVLFGNLVAVALRSYAEAAFLATYGAKQLPWLLIANAGGFAAATLGYDLVTRRAHTAVVDFTLLVVLGVTAAGAPGLLRAGASPAALVVALAAVSQVAGLALWNRVAAAVGGRDARRMLPRAGAGVTAGGVIAGLGAAPLVLHLGADVLPYIGAGVTVIVLGLAIAQAKALATGGAPGATAPPGSSEVLNDGNRRLLRGLIAVAIFEGIIATVVDLQFVAGLKARYHGDTLAVAVSLFYGGTNLLLLVLQATAVPRILVTRSLPTTGSIHPLIVILTYAAFAISPSFIGLAITRTGDQVFRLATSRTAQEVSLSAFPPGPRARWKVLLRGAVWPAAAGAAAFAILLVGPRTFLLHPKHLAAIGIGVALVWWIVAIVAARRFQTALAAPLNIRTVRVDDPTRIDLTTLEQWTQAAGDADARTAALARAALVRAKVDATQLGEHLRHDEADVRAALFDQLARTPSPALRNELRAAVMIEDDDRALALGLKALAIAGDDGALERGRSRAALSREVEEVVRAAEATLRGKDVAGELGRLLARDPAWANTLVRARRADLDDGALANVLGAALEPGADAGRRRGAFAVIARVGPVAILPALSEALARGDHEAFTAIAELDEPGAKFLAEQLDHFASPGFPIARLAIARALASAPAATALLAKLVLDADAEVATAALRSALAVTRGGASLPAGPIGEAHRVAVAALVAHLDARDGSASWSACAKHELELATRGCVVRVLWSAAVEASASGRDPAALAAIARRLIVGREPDRRRALDVVQELQTGRAEILAVLERWLRPPVARDGDPAVLAPYDPWLAQLCAGQLPGTEPILMALRKPALFANVAGRPLASLADHAQRREVEGKLFDEGDAGGTMYVVTYGALLARRSGEPERRIEVGGVVGELAVLTQAPRAATILADGKASVLEIDRATFATASRRAPELVLGLSATLAGWLATNRPDVL